MRISSSGNGRLFNKIIIFVDSSHSPLHWVSVCQYKLLLLSFWLHRCLYSHKHASLQSLWSVYVHVCELCDFQQVRAEATLVDRCVHSPFSSSSQLSAILVIFSFLCTDVSTFSSHLAKDDGHGLKAGENSALNVKVEEKKPIWITKEKNPVIISVCAWGDLSVCPRTPETSSPDSLTLMTWKWFCWME